MLDFIKILKGLNEKEIKYIIVGGIAVNFHGIPRMTYDLDLLVKLSDENIKKLINLFKAWGYKPKVPVDIMDFARKEKRNKWIKEKNMKAFCLKNNNETVQEIDIIIDSPVSYDEAEKNAVSFKLQNQLFPVAGIKDMIKMKEAAGRLQDDSDIRYLKQKNEEK